MYQAKLRSQRSNYFPKYFTCSKNSMPPCFSCVKPVQSSLSPKHEKLVMMSPHKNRLELY